MAQRTLRVEVVTPEGSVYSGDAALVVLPGAEGALGILPEHAPLIVRLDAGELQVTAPDGSDERLAIGQGFAEVTGTAVTVLTDMAIAEEKIDEESARTAMERARAAMEERPEDLEELSAIEASLRNSLAQIALVKKRRRH